MTEQVEQLLRNAQLRDELEPLLDESIAWMRSDNMTTECENEFLESMLAWERAPMAPIRDWFEPTLDPPPPEELSGDQIASLLAIIAQQLFEKNVVLDFTDHLSDRELYTLIYRDILPAYEKKIDRRGSYLHWDCSDTGCDQDAWLRYYASEEERRRWQDEYDEDLPPREEPPFRRDLPRAPL